MNPTNDFLGLLKQLLDFPRVIACLLFEFKKRVVAKDRKLAQGKKAKQNKHIFASSHLFPIPESKVGQ